MSKEKVYDEQISQLMTNIISICKEHDIPAFCTFGLDEDPEADSADEDGDLPTLWCSTSLPISDKKKDNVKINKLYKVQYEGYGIVPNFIAMTIRSEQK